MSFLYNLKIGGRIYALVGALLLFIAIIGGVGVYKMNVIGFEMEEIAERDIPLTRMLEKITVHQLEQAVLMEQALRFQGVTAHSPGETFESIVKHFKKLAHKTDEEILQAEEMAQDMIKHAHSEAALKEFQHVLEELKKIEKEHKEYEHHVFEIFDYLKKKQKYASSYESDYGSGSGYGSSAKMDKKIVVVEKEQKQLDKHIEALLEEMSLFTQDSMNRALVNEQRGKVLIATLSIVIFILASILAFVLSRSVTVPLGELTHSMDELAKNNLNTKIPETDYKDEVRSMADAMKIFQANMVRAKELEGQQERLKKTQQQRQDELNQLVGIFGSTIGAVFEQIVTSSKDMVSQSTNMMSQSQSSQDMASAVAKESEETSANAQALSAATEEMVASIREISEQVNRSSDVTKEAVEHSKTSEKQVKELQDISQEIEDVISLITGIAEQTNLLALNATIEAARAGEAGKGFAVVANEVKALASQTSEATEEIASKITSIQEASGQSAKSIAKIGEVIVNIDQYITAIVAAIEEQNATTEEIARSVQFVSESSVRVSDNVQKIQAQSSEVSDSSQKVNTEADKMSGEADILSREVETFLGAMQNTDVNDNTYEAQKISASAQATVNGQSWSGTASEISAAYVVVSPQMECNLGENVALTIDGIPDRITARVAQNENGKTTIQFPLNLDHLDKMKEAISKIA